MVSHREDKFKAKFCGQGDQVDIFLVLILGAKMEVYHIITVEKSTRITRFTRFTKIARFIRISRMPDHFWTESDCFGTLYNNFGTLLNNFWTVPKHFGTESNFG